MAANTVDELSKELAKQTAFIIETIIETRNDTIVDVSHMDKVVFDICNAIDALPVTEAKQLETKMATMISRLEDLGNELRAFQERLPDDKE